MPAQATGRGGGAPASPSSRKAAAFHEFTELCELRFLCERSKNAAWYSSNCSVPGIGYTQGDLSTGESDRFNGSYTKY